MSHLSKSKKTSSEYGQPQISSDDFSMFEHTLLDSEQALEIRKQMYSDEQPVSQAFNSARKPSTNEELADEQPVDAEFKS